MRTTAGELSELNVERENLIQDNSALKQERFNNEVRFKTKERHLIQTKKEIDELERMLNTFNALSSQTSLTNI